MTPDRPSDPPVQLVGTPHGAVACTDEGAGPALILIPGVPGTERDYRWLAPALDGFRLIRVDLPGFGQTQLGSWGYAAEGRASSVEAVLDALGVHSCVAVGHSMGGATAAALAAELAAYLGAEVLSWPDGGHNLQKTRAVEVADGLRAFANRCQIGG